MNNLSPEEAEQYLVHLYTKRPSINNEEYLDWLKEVADTRAATAAGKALRARADKVMAQNPGNKGLAIFIGVMFGARGYEEETS